MTVSPCDCIGYFTHCAVAFLTSPSRNPRSLYLTTGFPRSHRCLPCRRFRTSYNISLDYLLPASTGTSPSPGVFIGARVKGPVGSGTGMDGVFLAVNTTGFRVALTVAATNARTDLLLEGPLPHHSTSWGSLALQVAGETAAGLLFDPAIQEWRVLFEGLVIPAPRSHLTGKVAGNTVSIRSTHQHSSNSGVYLPSVWKCGAAG